MIEDTFQASRLENIIIAKNPHVLAGGQIEALQEIPVWAYIRLVADVTDWQALIQKPSHNSLGLVLSCVVRDEQLDSFLSYKLWRKRRQKRREVIGAIPSGHGEGKKRPAR